jgi:hypothetical protein
MIEQSPLKFAKQFAKKRSPTQMNSLRIQQQALYQETDLAIANVRVNQYQKEKQNVMASTSTESPLLQVPNSTEIIVTEAPMQQIPNATKIARDKKDGLFAWMILFCSVDYATITL